MALELSQKASNIIDLIKIKSNDINNINQQILDAATETVYDELKVNWKILRKEARKFLKGIKILQQEKIQFSENFRKTVYQKLVPENAASIIEMYKNHNLFLFQSQYLLLARFDDYLKKYLKQPPTKVLFTFEAKDTPPTTYIMSFREFILSTDSEGKISDFSKTKISQLDRALNYWQALTLKNVEDAFQRTHDRVRAANDAYYGVKGRFDRHFEVYPPKGGQKQIAIIMWQLGNKWTLNTLGNLGDLVEGYQNYLFDKTKENSIYDNKDRGEPRYFNHPFICFFMQKYVNQVDSLGAAYQEDLFNIELPGENQKIQGAAKKAKSSLPAISQFITVAQNILTKKAKDFKEEVEKEIKKGKEKIHNKTVEKLSDIKGVAREKIKDMVNNNPNQGKRLINVVIDLEKNS